MKKLGLIPDAITAGNGDIFYNIKETKQVDIVLNHVPARSATPEIKGIYTLSIEALPSVGDKVTIDNKTIEFVSENPEVNKSALIGATTTETATNLKTAYPGNDNFTITTDANKIVFTQTNAEVGDMPILDIEKVEDSTFEANIVTTTVGTKALANDIPAEQSLKKGCLLKLRQDGKYEAVKSYDDNEILANMFAGILGTDTDSTKGAANTFAFIEGQFVKSKIEEATGIKIPVDNIFNNFCNLIFKEEI